jgi:hypothetical protein
MESKKAYFVVGPESSGSRMITEALTRCGVSGDSGHSQIIGSFVGETRDVIVVRRSVPHGGIWPPLLGMNKQLVDEGYEVIPIVIYRDERITALSQIKNGHIQNLRMARKRIKTAKNIIEHAFDEPIVLQYETFVGDSRIRRAFFNRLGLEEPDMTYFNGNAKYD